MGDDSVIKERSAIRLSELDAKISRFGDSLLLFFPDFVLLLTQSAATPRCKDADCAHLVDGLVVLDGVKVVAGVVNGYRLVGGHYVIMGRWRIRLGEGVGIWMDFKRERKTMYAFVIDSSGVCYVSRHHFYFVAQAVSSDPDIRTEQSIRIWIGVDKIYTSYYTRQLPAASNVIETLAKQIVRASFASFCIV